MSGAKGGQVTTAEAKRAERHQNDDLQQQLAHDRPGEIRALNGARTAVASATARRQIAISKPARACPISIPIQRVDCAPRYVRG